LKIVTVNIPTSFIDAINKLIGQDRLYPSRSELIRCAVRDFLLKELKMAKNMAKYDQSEEKGDQDFNDEDFVRVPIEKVNEKSEPIREYKTYKIIRRFEDITSNSDNSGELRNHTQTTKYDDYRMEDKEFPSFEEIEKNKPGIQKLRENYPDLPDFKFINERLF
jgi:Arc/MetJ-type ribon-helix-helix transcriptional regulator